MFLAPRKARGISLNRFLRVIYIQCPLALKTNIDKLRGQSPIWIKSRRRYTQNMGLFWGGNCRMRPRVSQAWTPARTSKKAEATLKKPTRQVLTDCAGRYLWQRRKRDWNRYLHGANHAVNPEDVSKSSERDRRSKNYYILHPHVTTYEHHIHM